MPLGPGKYGPQAEKLLKEFGGTICMVLMTGGKEGPSFDIATVDPKLLATVPPILREVANAIAQETNTVDPAEEYISQLTKAAVRNWKGMKESRVAVFEYSKAVRQDPIQMLQLAAMVLLDKPIYMLVPKGTILPMKMRAIANGIEMFEEENLEDLKHALKRLMTKAMQVK